MAASLERVALTDPGWRALVDAHPAATPFHQPAWAAMLAESYGLHAFALVDRDGAGAVRAGLPVIEVARLRRRRWVSLPYTDRCAPLEAPGSDPRQLAAALAGARSAGGAGSLELRAPVPGGHEHEAGWLHLLALQPDPDAVAAGFRSNVRRNIRKAERSGVEVTTATDERELTEVFYGLHVATRRRQGVPVQPRRFFSLLWRRLIEPGLGSVLIGRLDGDPVAGVVLLRHGGTTVYKFGASDLTRQESRANNLVMWHAIRDACLAGDHTFDFGRTDDETEGLRAFKASWGAREERLVYSALADAAPQPGSGRAQAVLGAALRRSPEVMTRVAGELLYRFAA